MKADAFSRVGKGVRFLLLDQFDAKDIDHCFAA